MKGTLTLRFSEDARVSDILALLDSYAVEVRERETCILREPIMMIQSYHDD